MAEQFFIRRDFIDILPFLDSIRKQADSERGALGFLPEPAYAEAARQKKLILLVSQDGDKVSYVGHLLFGGIFPILRVRQIVVLPQYRRQQHASRLLRALVAQGEKESYLNVVANVATDLVEANRFYERHGFLSSRLKTGGKSRNRTINVRILQLDTPSLMSYMLGTVALETSELFQLKKRSSSIPLYAIDLNVFFDVVRNRRRSEDAGTIIEAALDHQIRLAVSQEFTSELRRTSSDQSRDPVLSFAKRLPLLPPQEKSKITSLADLIAPKVFPERFAQQKLKSTDVSDALHLAHAVAAGAHGYITSDTKVLDARDTLMQDFGLDVIGLAEFAELLDLPEAGQTQSARTTKNFRITAVSLSDLVAFVASEGISLEPEIASAECRQLAVLDEDGIIGVAIMRVSSALDHPSRSVVCVRQEHPFSSTVADYLISDQVRYCSAKAPCRMLMIDIPTHPITRRIAIGQGFQHVSGRSELAKMALGQPVTKANWNRVRLSVERLAGLSVQKECPRYDKPDIRIASNGDARAVQLYDFEALLSPTLLALPKRNDVIVPITRSYAADLLGTDRQFSFLEVPEAHFLRGEHTSTRSGPHVL
ncbi:GNAT family N-acetyltransferase [Bradyrhizobium elkanii]|uniref:GNAT family N-acetyltransferase n=1 Tax=Bradyrhizobium elkanii TaxID=29448 RepID=UPI0004B158F3|nr:GNAT family N-acetyltransferase [Bradyrhizobium elkanii]WLA84538.1 GNAT family N-acetyltransferase [Bradyrhizobium elkanii]